MSLEVGKPWIVWRLGLFIWASGLFIAGWFLTDPETQEAAYAVYAPLPQDVAVEEGNRSEERSSVEDDENSARHN
jgi:hypothetical protein